MTLIPDPSTTEGKKALFKAGADQQLRTLFNQNKIAFNNLKNSFWNNQLGLTPQEAFDSFGTDAGTIVTLKGMLANLINAAVPDTVDPNPPAPLTETVNQNGTVTVV